MLPNIDALKVPDQQVLVFLLSGSGGFHRRCFVGGNAYGIPLKTYAVEWVPRTGPQCVFTTCCCCCGTLSSKTLHTLTTHVQKNQNNIFHIGRIIEMK